MSKDLLDTLSGEVLDDDVELTLAELCQACGLSVEYLFELVEHAVVEPRGRDPERWRFPGVCVRRVRMAVRLQRDLDVNIAGVALALDLLDELERMQARLRRLQEQ